MNRWLLAGLLAMAVAGVARAAETVVYRCPGPPVLYTDSLTAREAQERGCRTIEGTPITVIQGASRPRADGPTAEARINAEQQRARDAEARRILTDELRREERRLADLKKEYNDGQPERLGSERNYQRYLDRVAELKTSIERTEDNIAALKRELAKLGA